MELSHPRTPLTFSMGFWLLFVGLLADSAQAQFKFQHHFGDANLPGKNIGHTDLADLDNDGDLDFILGHMYGSIFWYEYRAANEWVRHPLGNDSPSGVGAKAFDVNGDGWKDLIAAGAWYENPKTPRNQEFIRHLFDPEHKENHDLLLGDIDGDGRIDMVTMSDPNDIDWYVIPAVPEAPWKRTHVGDGVHAGISLGDIDRDGDLDIVRSNVWFENLELGKSWTMHQMSEPWGANWPSFAMNATRTAPIDLNGDGRLDVVIVDNENPHAKAGWLEAPADPWTENWIKHPLPRGDDAFLGALHSLQLADFDNDGDLDIFTVEMEAYPGAKDPRWFIWENLGKGELKEHVILDMNLGGHESVVGDVDGDGDIDICSKPWKARPENALGGKAHFSYLENLLIE